MNRINKKLAFIIVFLISKICWSQDSLGLAKKVRLGFSAQLIYSFLPRVSLRSFVQGLTMGDVET